MKLKQLLSVVLMLCMVASSCVAFAAPQFDAAYECSGVSFGYEDGETWTDADSLKGGQEISAKVSVSKTGDKESAVFSLFVYKNGKMHDCEIVTLEVGEEPVEFKATASVPADPEGCQAVAVLWNNFYDMEMLCDSALFPSANTKLRGLYADGVLVDGFDPDVTEYSYALATDAQKYPDISWQVADSSVKVTYTKPSAFPGRSIVTVEAADGSKTEYSIKYVSEVGDFISNIGGEATNPVYVKGGVVVGKAAYNDRDATPTSYIITAIGDPSYEGADMIQGSIGWQSNDTFKSTAPGWITFDAARGVTVKVLKSDTGATQHFIDAGFTMETTDLETGFVQTTTNAVKNHKVAMSKHFDAGKVSIPAGNSGVTYLIAIFIDPIGGIDEEDPDEPVVPEDESLALESISIDGVALEGFDASVNEYTHILTTAQLTNEASPEVTYTLMDETSTAEVSMPESFPGSVTITVTNAEEEKAEYVINYDARNMVTNFANDVQVAKSAVYVPGGLKVGGNVASDRMGETQWKISEHIPSIEGGDTILTPVDGWKDVVSTFSFDLARKGTLTVIQNNTNMLSAYTEIGFVADTDVKTTKVKILNNTGTDSRIYQFMASKEVEAGNITLPYTKPNMPTLTVFQVVPWSNEAAPDNSILLSDIKIDGVSVEGFDSEENTYYVELTPSQLSAKEAPVVTYTLADSRSTSIMERTSSFPGSVKITVYGKDFVTNTYTINYIAETVKDLALNEVAGANAPQPVYKQNFKVGDATYSDRDSNFLTSYIDEAYVGKDRIIYGLGWKNDWEKQYCIAFTGDRVDWVTFTAARDMEVIVFEAANANSEYVGFTAESSTTPYITAHASSNGDLNYKYKYTKRVSAGDKVALPNVDVSNRIGTVVINAAPWGGFDAEGGDEPEIPPVVPEDSLEIMKVKDGKDGIVVFVHDDGDYNTASYLAENFTENGLKGSVGLIVSRIKDSNKASWQELFDTGVLNAESHSMTHTYVGQDNTKDETAMVNGVETFIPAGKMETEIAGSKAALKELFPNQNPLVYIRPGVGTITDMEGNPLTATNANAIAMMKEHYIAARVTGRTAYTKQGVDTIPPTDYFAMYSIMPGNDTTYEDMMESVDEAVSENGILVFCFHGISDQLSDSNATRKSETDKVFADVGEYVAEGKVWNPFYADAVKYMKETETAAATMETAGDAIEVTLTDELDNEIFDYPLTVKVPVPGDWEYALLTQGERTENPKTFTEGDETYVYANIVPDGGKATLEKSDLIVDDLSLTSIKIDGAEIKGFKEDTTEYSYTLTPNQVESIEAPIVTYTLADADNSSAVVTNPTEFPGSVTITVTNKDSETRTYTVNYRSNAVLTDITVADSSVRNADFVSGGFVVGEAPYHNRSYPIQEINDESLVGKDYIKGNIEWQSNATFNSATYTPWITMNSRRKVTVTILKTVNNGAAEMMADGFTSKISDNPNGFVKADTNSQKNFMYAYTKEFEPGEVVIPNGMTNKAYFVVFSYAPWGVEDGEESDEPFYEQSVEIAPFEGEILVSGSFKANTEAGKGYYVVLKSYENGEVIKTEKSDKLDLVNGKNTFNIPFNPSFIEQNAKAYIEAEDGTVICESEELTIKTLKHLFIGNSFSTNAHRYLYQIAQDAGYNNIVLGTIYKGGCSLETHADYAKNNTAGYTYYKNSTGAWITKANSTMLQGVADEDWMTISFQQASTYSGKADSYEPYLTNLIEFVNENKTNPDAKYVWHMTWAYQQGYSGLSGYSNDQMTMYNGIVNAVQTKILTKDDFIAVIPSGTAIQNARTSFVGDNLSSDGLHLEDHGCYIAGLMTFKTITGEDITDIDYDFGFTHDNFLAIAKESVNNAYAKPYEVTKSAYAPVETVGLVKTIKVDGNAIANFDAETLTYDVTLTDNQMAASAYPNVTAELNDTEASVNVTAPTSFPGSATVEVTKGEETKTYTINYKTPAIDIAITADAPANTPKPEIAYGAKVGDLNFKDRTTFGIIAVNDEDITEDTLRIKTCIGWQTDNNSYSEFYTSSHKSDWLNFTAPRTMVVTVYEDNQNNTNLFDYWTTETSSTPYIEAAASNSLKYNVKHRRVFEAGDKVEIPNARGGRTFTATINYIGWDEDAPELDVTIPVVRQISDSDLVMKVTKGDGINVTEGQWSGISDVITTKYQLSKEFTDITEPTEISITTDKIAKGYGIIVVAPLDGEATDKNVIVNADGSELEWTEDTSVVVDYSYTNDGDEDFDEANATYGRYNDSAVTFSGGTAYLYEKMHNSDDMYITGSKLGWGRSPYTGELHWTGLPDEYLGCNYIVVPFDGGFDGGERTFTFTVDQPVKVWVHSSASNMTVTDTIDDAAWTASQYVVRRRYQNVLDHLSCAYMLKKGYINESNIIFDGKVGTTNGVRFNRYDVYEKLKADCGSYLGWAIDPEKVEATGFTNSINSYRYEEYLEAWVD